MATSLDEAMEHFFEGWTPAPPAADHSPFNNPSYRPHSGHRGSALHQPSSKMLLSQGQSAALAQKAATTSSQRQGAGDGWEEWESPFHSRSTSPDAENQCPNDHAQLDTGISAWRAYSPSRRHCQAAPHAVPGGAETQHGVVAKQIDLCDVAHR